MSSYEKWFVPYLDTSVRALPHHYRNLPGETGDCVKFIFLGATEKSWYLHYDTRWELRTSTDQTPTSEVRIKDVHAWKIFTKGMTRTEAIEHAEIAGNQKLGEKIFDMIAVMA